MILAGDIGATAIRAKLLKAFEIAEIEVDPAQHRDLLTFVLVGAGPIGVEMAEAVSALKAAGDTNRQLVESRPARAGTGFMNVSTRIHDTALDLPAVASTATNW